MTFSKRGLSVRQFRCNMALLWQPANPNDTLKRAHFSVSRSIAFDFIGPRYRDPETLGVVNMVAKPQFASAHQFFRKGNGGGSGNNLFSLVLSLALIGLSLFYHLAAFLLQKHISPPHPSSPANSATAKTT